MDSCVPFRKSRSVGFKSFKSFLTLVTCSQSFLQKHFTIVRLVFFVAEVAQFDFLHTNISSNMLQTLLHCFLKVAIYNLFRYVYYLYTMPPGVHLALTFKGSQTCFIMTLFAFLPTSTFDSNLLN